MATARNVIDSAMKLLRVFPSDTVPTASEYADGLEALGNLLREWSAPTGVLGITLTPISGVVSSAQTDQGFLESDLFGAPVVSIEQLCIRSGSIDTLYNNISYVEYVAIPNKFGITNGLDNGVYARRPFGDWRTALHIWPSPPIGTLLVGAAALMITTPSNLDMSVVTTGTVALPLMEQLLSYGLALELARRWQAPLDGALQARYNQLLRAQRAQSFSPPVAKFDARLPGVCG